MTHFSRSSLSALVIVVASVVIVHPDAVGRAAGADWPNWRGPAHNGVSTEAGWRTNWTENGPKQLWEASIGAGYSSVAVVASRAYTMGHKDGNDIVWCLNADTGKEIWRKSYPSPKNPRGGYSGPRATPTVDGKNVYTLSHDGQVFCLAADSGEVIWQKNIQKETNAVIPHWGFAGSPLVVGKNVVLNVGSAGVALDKATGKIVWKSGAGKAGYATPVLFETSGRKYLAIFGAASLAVVDAAGGRLIGQYPWKTAHDVNAADPIISGSRIFISSNYGVGCALLRFRRGKLELLWRNKKMMNHFNSCVLWKGRLYGFDAAGLKCMDFAGGQIRWSRRGFGRQSSLVIADGKMIILEERGTLVIAEASADGYKELARKKVLSGTCWTAPVLSGGRIFCRNHRGKLICLEVGPSRQPAKPKPTVKKSSPAGGKPGPAESCLAAAGGKEKASAIRDSK